MRSLFQKIYLRIRVFLWWVIKHIWKVQLLVAICTILSCSYLLSVWYGASQKTITYTIKTHGCIGTPKCKILGVLNYSGTAKMDTTGFFAILRHPFRKHSPFLFKNNVFESNTSRRNFIDEYEPLCNKYASAIDSISTLYKSIVNIETNSYYTSRIKTENQEFLRNEQENITYKQPIFVCKNKVESECWFYMKRLQEYWGLQEDTISMQHSLSMAFPIKWYSFGDISKLNFHLKLNFLYGDVECEEITILFKGPYSLASVTMEPDEKGYSYISFKNPYKLQVISRRGLSFFVSFPNMEKIQNTRIACLLVIFPFLISWLIYIIKIIIVKRKTKNV